MEAHDDEDEFDAPWNLLDDGEPEAVLELLAELDAAGRPHPESAALACLAHSDMGSFDLAERVIGPEPAAGARGRDAWLLARGELDLATWRVDEARSRFLALEDSGASTVGTRLRLSLVADLAGDADEARRWIERARELDADAPGCSARLDDDAFDEVVASAIAELPPEFRARLDEVPVIVEPVPALEGGLPPVDVMPDTLGLFRGVNDLERSFEASAEIPPAIHLYRNNLERRAIDVDELREEIRITLYHELGHLLGFDEEGVESMGLG
ncbi:MAG: metallopeptidase family protein [Planctomycetota bacterium]